MIHFKASMSPDGSLSIASTNRKTKEAQAIENIVKNVYAGFNPKNVVANRLSKLEALINGEKGKFTPTDLDLVSYYKTLMDPLLWEDILFIPDQLHGLMKDDQPFMGTRIVSCEGKQIKTKQIPADEATDDDIKNTIISDFINPAGKKLVSIISHTDIKYFKTSKPELAKVINDLTTELCSWGLTSVRTWYPLIVCPYTPRR